MQLHIRNPTTHIKSDEFYLVPFHHHKTAAIIIHPGQKLNLTNHDLLSNTLFLVNRGHLLHTTAKTFSYYGPNDLVALKGEPRTSLACVGTIPVVLEIVHAH